MQGHVIPELDSKGLREFAITTGIVLAILFGIVIPWIFEFSYPQWPWIVAGALILWGLVHAPSLRPVYRGWMRFGLLLNKITTPIIMGIVFFLVLFPTGLFMRWVLRRDPLSMKLDSEIESYRVISEPTQPDNLVRPF